MIEELEKKGFRVSIRPQKMNGTWYWVAGVHIGDEEKATWVDSNNNLPWACYNTYKEALEAVVNYCENKGTKRQRRSKI